MHGLRLLLLASASATAVLAGFGNRDHPGHLHPRCRRVELGACACALDRIAARFVERSIGAVDRQFGAVDLVGTLRDQCIEAGASDYVSKPVDVERLVSLLRVWLYR